MPDDQAIAIAARVEALVREVVASDASKYVTGSVLTVDDGRSLAGS